MLEEVIGRGGMAIVYRARNAASGQLVALKRLLPRKGDDEQLSRSRELFEREFHTLAQLAHPRIVATHDYGLDGDAPYYTMELLDGGDLLERAPLPWRQACAIGRDICSALSLVHSRRLVHRDLSARNVRCTADAKAKLIDFGALTLMGLAPPAVCTPAVASPEVVHRQPLDGRSDLYALGATLYYTLVGRTPYPARSFQQLSQLWQHPLRSPSEQVADIPAELDALVMDLLQLDPQLRPVSAAEVSQRLSALAGLPPDDVLLVSQAYLTTPTLVGRESELRRVGGMINRVLSYNKGSAALVCGPAGVGRSRLLDACVLSAKLGGVQAVRIDPASAPPGPYGAARAITEQLLEALPDETLRAAEPHRALLGALVPELRARLPEAGAEGAGAQPPSHPQTALRGFLLELASVKPLLIAADDVDHFDAESQALIALLAHRAEDHPLVVVAASSGESMPDSDAGRLLTESCAALLLRALEPQQTHALLASIFGDVPNLALLVRRLHALAGGNARDLMQLAQHLLDRGVVCYHGGAWVLPDHIDDASLPASMAQALRAAVARLSDDARVLGRALAQCPEQRFGADECIALSEHDDRARTFRSLDQLRSSGIIAQTEGGYALAAKTWVAALSGEPEPALQVRLARVFERRGDGLRAAQHLFAAGRESEGLDVLVAFAKRSHQETSSDPDAYVRMLATLPREWFEIYATALALCGKLGRPAFDKHLIELRWVGLFSQNDRCSDGQCARVTGRMARDAGLDLYATLEPSLPPDVRLQQALAAAAQRYESTPERDRVLHPKQAIGQLARAVITAIGNFSRTLDLEEWRQLPSLAPLAPLSPAVAVVDRLARGFEARVSGRFELACEIYRETLRLLNGGAGLDATFVDSVRAGLYGIMGTIEAALGLPSCEQHAVAVAEFPLYQGSALAIRVLDKLWQGDVGAADQLARQRELWRLEQSRQQVSDVVTVLWTLQAHAASDDLTHTRHDLEAIERTAKKIRTWQPIASWARGEYERIRGDHAAALAALDAALSQLQPGQHQILAAGRGRAAQGAVRSRRLRRGPRGRRRLPGRGPRLRPGLRRQLHPHAARFCQRQARRRRGGLQARARGHRQLRGARRARAQPGPGLRDRGARRRVPGRRRRARALCQAVQAELPRPPQSGAGRQVPAPGAGDAALRARRHARHSTGHSRLHDGAIPARVAAADLLEPAGTPRSRAAAAGRQRRRRGRPALHRDRRRAGAVRANGPRARPATRDRSRRRALPEERAGRGHGGFHRRRRTERGRSALDQHDRTLLPAPAADPLRPRGLCGQWAGRAQARLYAVRTRDRGHSDSGEPAGGGERRPAATADRKLVPARLGKPAGPRYAAARR